MKSLTFAFAVIVFIMSLFKETAAKKLILVTGANKGIGKAICQRILVEFPDTHVLLGSRDQSRGELAVKSILESAVGDFASRIDFVHIDISDDDSVTKAATGVAEKYNTPLYGLVNNAGIGFGNSAVDTLNTNYYGTKRVCKAFLPLMDKQSGQIVNIASASGPMFLAKSSNDMKAFFSDVNTSEEEHEQKVQEMIPSIGGDAYGFSKACLNLYTLRLAKENPELRVTSCTPGFIDTDLTAGMGATGTCENGANSALFCLFGDEAKTGCYYGSDSIRSPMTQYRGPGDPAYNP
jgi:carbonyl reductase 1